MQAMVRAIYRVAAIPGARAPYDRVSLKIYYPASYGDTPDERNSGVVPANREGAPYPVVILLPGINLSPESSSWLCCQLADAGYVAVTTSSVAEEMPGYISISPGLRLDRLGPDGYGTEPSCTLLQPVIEELQRIQEDSVLAGLLDLEHIALGGHSAGGTAALLNANPAWFPGVCAVFAYAAHSGASMALGWPAETVLKLPAALPTLLLGGDRDGVIAASAHRYGREDEDPLHTIRRTFDEGVADNDGRSFLLLVAGANHFSFAHPHDGSTGREFLDWETAADPGSVRTRLAGLIVSFLDSSLRGDAAAAEQLVQAVDSPGIALGGRK